MTLPFAMALLLELSIVFHDLVSGRQIRRRAGRTPRQRSPSSRRARVAHALQGAKHYPVILFHRLRPAGAAIMIKIRTVTMLNARLIGRVANTVGSPREISIARRRFSSSIGPSTNPSIIGTGLHPSFLHTMPRMPKTAVR